MIDSLEFGRRLKALRQERGLTQDVLSERVGCATETIRKIESGRRRPSYQMAARIGEVLRLDPEELAAWMRAMRSADQSGEGKGVGIEAVGASDEGRLPVYLTPLIGREQDLAVLSAILAQPSYRLVTLLGPGGVGKTRLAIELGRMAKGFKNGVVFVPLAPVASPEGIVTAIGAALKYTFSGPTALQGQLLRHLHNRHVLLILDNLEHLLTDAEPTLSLLQNLLAAAPHVTLVVTSRERVKLPGEWVREMTGLTVPPADDLPFTTDYPACVLFAELARRVQEDFRLGPQNRGTVASICRLVGGLPLGIELAASWLRVLSPAEIGRELANKLDVQHLSPGTSPARHRSLWSLVDHSWNLLSDKERQVLARLAVFQGGFRREAAAAVAGADLLMLAGLVDKSLLRRKVDGRFDLHEIIRQYTAARLEASSEERTAARDDHADYFCQWMGARQFRLHSAEMLVVMAEIGAEIDNIRKAWQWAAERGRFAALRQAADTLQWYYEFRSWFAEGTTAFHRAAETLREASPGSDSDEHRHTLGEILARLVHMAIRRGDMELARVSLEEALSLLKDSPDLMVLANLYVNRGTYAFFVGDYEQAQRAVDSCRAVLPPGEQILNAFCDTWENFLSMARGEFETAERYFRSGLARYRALEHPRGIVIEATFCSAPLIAVGKFEELDTLLNEGVRLADLMDDRYCLGAAYFQMGLAAAAQQHFEEAITRFHEALAIFQVLGSQWDIARVSNQLGGALLSAGQFNAAEQAFLEALSKAAELHIDPEMLQAMAGLATLLAEAGRDKEAMKLATCILADPAASIATRAQARQLGDALRERLPKQVVVEIEREASDVVCHQLAAQISANYQKAHP